jgi:sulfur carrier protein ThiS
MKINIELSGALKRKAKENCFELEVAEGKTVHQVLLDMGYKEEEIRYLIAILNGNRVELATTLQEGDRLRILLPIGGG